MSNSHIIQPRKSKDYEPSEANGCLQFLPSGRSLLIKKHFEAIYTVLMGMHSHYPGLREGCSVRFTASIAEASYPDAEEVEIIH